MVWNKGIKTGLVPRTAFKKGHTPWSKGKNVWENKIHPNFGKHLAEETKEKIRQARLKYGVYLECPICKKSFKRRRKSVKFCSRTCAGKNYSLGGRIKKICPYCQKEFLTLKCYNRFCCSNNCSKKYFIKEKHPSWRGGIKKDRDKRKSYDCVQWRKAVFERDNYICQICGLKSGCLQADHIKPFSRFPELRFDINNGRTLCVGCHRKTDTYGAKSKKALSLNRISHPDG